MKTSWIVLGLSGLISSQALSAEAPSLQPPNIVFILVDDQRNDTLGCAGHPVIKTPHIDRLAEHGVRFENAFVTTPICMSSRATLFTGMTETGHGYTGGGPPAIPVQEMDVDSSLPVLLRGAGYRTGFYGKQHVKFAESKAGAMKRMFDDHRVYGGGPHLIKQPDGSMRHTAELIGDRSVEFIETQKGDRPFFLYMSFNIAHARDGDHRPGIGHFPWPRQVDGLYEDIEPLPPRLGDPSHFDKQPAFLKDSLNRDRWYWRWDTAEKYRINMRAYYRMLSGMDAVVGRVLQTLETRGFSDDTVVIYSADNGYYMGERGFAGKWTHYEESLRVPLIIHDPRPDRVKPGWVAQAMALNLDLPPTMLEMAGIRIPEKYQGASLLPMLKGRTPAGWRTEFFCEHHSTNPRIPEWLGVRGERFTYARYTSEDPVFEMLHDLETDPDQLQNLAAVPSHGEIMRALRQKTDEYVASYSRPAIIELKKASLESP